MDELLADEQVESLTNAALNETLWALSDHLGSVRDVVDSNGKLRIHRQFDSFGNIVGETHYATDGATPVSAGQTGYVDESFAYTGKFFDAATGLQNNLFRWYDPATGRWIREDPIGFLAGDANLNRYVGNEPTGWVDPLGLHGEQGGGESDESWYERQRKLRSLGCNVCVGGWNTVQRDPWRNSPVDWRVVRADLLETVRSLPGLLSEIKDEIAGVLFEPIDWLLTAKEIYDDPRNPLSYAGLIPGIPAGVGKAAKGLLRHGDEAAKLTGQMHHGISRPIHRALEEHVNLSGIYRYRDPRFVTQARNLASHNGYQDWHRQLDQEIVEWIRNNAQATQELFEGHVRGRYNEPDLLYRFPNGF